jgi:predicted ATPase
MIKQFRVTNFKSLADVAVSLTPVTVLIGRSGSGKTNFVQALRWLRDLLVHRDWNQISQGYGGWDQIICATSDLPAVLTFRVQFDVPGYPEDFAYSVAFHITQRGTAPGLSEEILTLGNRCVFKQQQGKWIEKPPLINPPPPHGLMLGALTGVQESSVAHYALKDGIGCYSFSDRVLMGSQGDTGANQPGFQDDGGNYLHTFSNIYSNLQTWQRQREIEAALRRLKPNLKSIDLAQPNPDRIAVTLEVKERRLPLSLQQESEGFRRLFACLLALYQTPGKQTLIFDEPEKGIYPAGLSILAEEFQSHASKGRGQIILTTHSPEFLDQFQPEQIRVVEMRGYTTHIGTIAKDQLESIREHFIRPGELLIVDQARAEPVVAG